MHALSLSQTPFSSHHGVGYGFVLGGEHLSHADWAAGASRGEMRVDALGVVDVVAGEGADFGGFGDEIF